MIRSRALILSIFGIFTILGTPAQAEWTHLKNSLYAAPENDNKYLREFVQTIVVAADTEENVNVCAAVGDDVNNSDGRVHVLFEMARWDDELEKYKVERKRKKERMEDNLFLKCQETRGFRANDMITATYTFSGFPRIRSTDGIGAINIVTSVGADRLKGSAVYGPQDAESVTLGAGQWRHLKNSFYTAPEDSNKYLKKLMHTIIVAADTAKNVNLCAGVGDDVDNSDGKVHVLFEMNRYDEAMEESTVEKKRRSGKVADNRFLKCQETGRFRAGDVISAIYTFSGFPRIRSERGVGAINVVTSLAKNRLEPGQLYGPPPPPPPTPAPNPNPSPNPNPNPNPSPNPNPAPSPGGGLSSADFSAAAKLLKGNKPSQLWRAKTSWGFGVWVAVGPKTQIDRTKTGNVNPKTVGFGATIAAAVANYEQKMGKLANGSPLSTASRNGLIWYSKINSSAGPTSIRRNPAGSYFGEYYRPGRGAHHNGPYATIAQAIAWLQKQGL